MGAVGCEKSHPRLPFVRALFYVRFFVFFSDSEGIFGNFLERRAEGSRILECYIREDLSEVWEKKNERKIGNRSSKNFSSKISKDMKFFLLLTFSFL